MRKNKPELPTEFTLTKGQNVMSTVLGFQQDAMNAFYCSKKLCSQYVFNDAYSFRNRKHFESENKHYSVLQQIKGSVDILGRMVRSNTKHMT